MLENANVKAQVMWLLGIVIILNLAYPVTELGQPAAIIYTSLYSILIGIGVYAVSISTHRFLLSVMVSISSAILNIFWNLNPNVIGLSLATYIVLVVFQAIIIYVLSEFIFTAPRVTKAVLLAAVTLFMLLGDIFIPLFMTIELLTQQTTGSGAFMISSAPDTAVTWQNMAYFSFSTLTTVGYGDVTAVTSMARAVASFEAVIGVLFIAMLIGRLVGVYSREDELD
ncbi:MAG: potassium channel family protein [Chloroflexi bacterium]|nr:potassium channel family protein [Chloroflexota bacterium]